MRYRSLGRSGLLVSELGLGTMTFGDAEGMFRPINGVDQALAEQIVSRSLEAGINYFDTADAYAAGQSESILGTAFRSLGVKRSDVVIATKGYGRMGSSQFQRDLGFR